MICKVQAPQIQPQEVPFPENPFDRRIGRRKNDNLMVKESWRPRMQTHFELTEIKQEKYHTKIMSIPVCTSLVSNDMLRVVIYNQCYYNSFLAKLLPLNS